MKEKHENVEEIFKPSYVFQLSCATVCGPQVQEAQGLLFLILVTSSTAWTTGRRTGWWREAS